MFGESSEPSIVIDDKIMEELVAEYAKLDPDTNSLELGIPHFKIKRAIKSLLNVMKKRGIDVGVEFKTADTGPKDGPHRYSRPLYSKNSGKRSARKKK